MTVLTQVPTQPHETLTDRLGGAAHNAAPSAKRTTLNLSRSRTAIGNRAAAKLNRKRLGAVPESAILWEGRSVIDGAPIVVIATRIGRKSNNPKTGDMVQTFILRRDMHPVEAVTSGADVSICGDCDHRPIHAKARGAAPCYVSSGKAPASVWRAYKAGSYPTLTPWEAAEVLSGMAVRIGAYGDPAAAPFGLWATITAKASAVTGYTHQWRTADERFSRLCMASADSSADKAQANDAGWRTFRVLAKGEAPAAGEVACPASKEAGAKTNCAACRACGGTDAKARASIAIQAH